MSGSVAESLAKRLSECGFEAKKRVSGSGVAENVKMWKDMIKKKELIVKSRNSVLFAWIVLEDQLVMITTPFSPCSAAICTEVPTDDV